MLLAVGVVIAALLRFVDIVGVIVRIPNLAVRIRDGDHREVRWAPRLSEQRPCAFRTRGLLAVIVDIGDGEELVVMGLSPFRTYRARFGCL